jgi:dTDP-4-dehydrorhamnose reductase
MKILLFGAGGNLGKELTNGLRSRNVELDAIGRSEFNILNDDISILKKIIQKKNYDFIINCSALIGIMRCEKERREAYQINSNFLLNISKTVFNTKIIHFSSDNVFECYDKNEIHTEFAQTRPTTWYGITKLIGENELKKYTNSLIIRLPLLFSKNIKSSKLTVNTLLKKITEGEEINAYDDVYNTPILIELIEPFLYKHIITKNNKNKVINLYGDRYLTLYEIIKNLCVVLNLDVNKIKPISLKETRSKLLKPRFGGLASNVYSGFFFDSMLNNFNGDGNGK